MANTDAPFGFKPVAHLTGGEIRARSYLADEDGDTIFRGDAVTMSDNGKITLAAADDILVGIAAEYKATLEGANIMVYDDPNIIFEVQGYTGVTTAQGMVGETANLVATAGSSTTYVSLQELNAPSTTYEAADQFVILGKVDRPDNAWGEHCKLLVKIYKHFSSYTVASS